MTQNGIELDKHVLNSLKLSYDRSRYYYYIKRGKLPHKIFRPFVETGFWQEQLAQLKNRFTPDPSLSETVYNCKGKEHYFIREFFPEPCIMFLYDDEHLNDSVSILYDSESDQDQVNKLRTTFENYQSRYDNNKIGYLVSEKSGLSIMYGKFKPYKDDYSSFLGQKVDQFRDQIIDDLSTPDSTGLYLIHGKPGTGKTSFIKTVLATSSRQPIYIPTNFIESLSSPSLLGQLMREPNSVLILEDADTALIKRSGDNSSAVSTLLNLTDGFMADFLSPIVICTFNTPLSDIDSALLRTGRLRGICEFKPLRVEAANALSELVGFERSFTNPTLIADVLNQNNQANYNREAIGF